MQLVNEDASYNRSAIMKRSYAYVVEMRKYRNHCTLGMAMKDVWSEARRQRQAKLASLDFARIQREASANLSPDASLLAARQMFTVRVNQMIEDAKYIDDPFAYQAEMNRINRLRFEPIVNVVGVNQQTGD